MMSDAVKIIVPSGMFGANMNDDLLCAMLRQVGEKYYSGDSLGWDDPAKYGCVFEDERFLMHPDYQDAECNCGHWEESEAWHAANPHTESCYTFERDARVKAWDIANNYDQVEKGGCSDIFIVNGVEYTDYGLAQAEFRSTGGFWNSERSPRAEAAFQQWCKLDDKKREAERAIAKRLCRERRIPWNKGWGSAVHCDCGKEERSKEWYESHGHTFRCPVEVPNFWYKATELQINWYKYIGRDMKANRAFTQDELLQISNDLLGRSLEQIAEQNSIDAARRAEELDAAMNRIFNAQ